MVYRVRNILLILITFILTLTGGDLAAQYYFDDSPNIRKAYVAATSLKFTEADSIIQIIKKEEPENLLVVHIENYIDFFSLFISEDKKEFDRLIKNKSKRLDYITEYGDQNSPYYLFVQAEIELQWAVVRAKFKQLFKAGSGSYTAYKLLKKNVELYPEFVANKKSLSAIHALAKTVPGIVKMLFGIDGSLEQSISEIEEVIKYSENNNFLYREEAIAVYVYIQFYQNNQKNKAYEYLLNSELDPSKNPLACFLIATMAQKMNDNEKALETLLSRPRGNKFAPFYYLDFMEGKSWLYKLDKRAKAPILNFIKNFKGRHYIKEAYQKLAWYELSIQENYPMYKYYMKEVEKYGYDLIDEDKQALKESHKNQRPNVILLRARLLYDGGYLQKAYALLIKNAYQFTSKSDWSIEYNYRLGRITHALKSPFDALSYYGKSLLLGTNSKEYYPCSSALHMGYIYENEGLYKEARMSYKKCLELKPSDYANSLHQKAKSGLQRLPK